MIYRAATVGTFDGVHLGHLAVIDALKRLAEQRSLVPMVVTFDRHPLETVAPERAPKRLMSPDEEAAALQALGVEVRVEEFTPQLMRQTAREWMEGVYRRMGVRALVMGYDNTFGCDGVDMSVEGYQMLGTELGIEVVEASVVAGVSSSSVRRVLDAGDVDKASEMLGRFYRLAGMVTSGRQLGRTIGFPTANLEVDPCRLVPANGVYACRAVLDNGTCRPAVVNIGVRPTVGEGLTPTVEAHLPGWDGNLYGRSVMLEFVGRLRGECRFGSLEELKGQIARDCQAAEKILFAIGRM